MKYDTVLPGLYEHSLCRLSLMKQNEWRIICAFIFILLCMYSITMEQRRFISKT
jgi:hypothetical protein